MIVAKAILHHLDDQAAADLFSLSYDLLNEVVGLSLSTCVITMNRAGLHAGLRMLTVETMFVFIMNTRGLRRCSFPTSP